jgi:hypothetical protein
MIPSSGPTRSSPVNKRERPIACGSNDDRFDVVLRVEALQRSDNHSRVAVTHVISRVVWSGAMTVVTVIRQLNYLVNLVSHSNIR